MYISNLVKVRQRRDQDFMTEVAMIWFREKRERYMFLEVALLNITMVGCVMTKIYQEVRFGEIL